MKNLHRTAAVPLIVFLASCSSDGGGTPTVPPATNVPGQDSTPTPAPTNLALNKNVTASAQTAQEPTSNAVDGSSETAWNAGGAAPQWIQIDLGAPATVSSVHLTVAQTPDGETIHQVLAGVSLAEMKLVHEFRGATSDNQVLVFTFGPPLTGIRFVEIRTTRSPSWVAWKEIEILGTEGGQPSPPQSETGAADLIYYNGRVLTMEKSQPTAQAIAIKGERILAVGSDSDVMHFKGASTRLIDLKGMTLTPGFIDSHAHRIGDRWHFGEVSAEQMMAEALSQGWTSLHELFVSDQRLEELVSIDRANAMPLRVSTYLTMNFEYEYTRWWQAYQPLHQYSPYLQIAGLKITLDREWGEQVFFSQEQFTQMVLDGTRSGWQIATHSFSPKANQIVLNGYETGLSGQGNDALRLRLEHVGTMTDEQLRRMAELDIIGSVGFINAGGLVEDASFRKYIPASEVQHTARWRDMINAGVFLIGNTDDPWCCTDWRNGFQGPSHEAAAAQAIYQAMTRRTFTGRKPEPWQVAQVVTAQEALEMLTINGAYAAHQESVIGSLKPGKYADIVILSGNPLITPIEQVPNLFAVMTMVGGKVKYCAPGGYGVCGTAP